MAPHVLRHWEDEGVLVPARDAQRHRRYSEDDLTIARGVRRAQAAGLSLAQVRTFLDSDEAGRQSLLLSHADELAARMAALSASRGAGETALASPNPGRPYGV